MREFGTVVRVFLERGFFFMKSDYDNNAAREIFGHVRSINNQDHRESVRVGMRVSFELVKAPKGFAANNIRLEE
jgi:cold shock CspA family protein